jgi:hypothetical protein
MSFKQQFSERRRDKATKPRQTKSRGQRYTLGLLRAGQAIRGNERNERSAMRGKQRTVH